MMTQEQLDVIRARVEAATPGEWWWYGPPHSYSGGEQLVTTDDKKPILWTELMSDRIEVDHDNADLIANAPADIRALLAEVDALRRVRLPSYLDAYDEGANDALRARIAELEAENMALSGDVATDYLADALAHVAELEIERDAWRERYEELVTHYEELRDALNERYE